MKMRCSSMVHFSSSTRRSARKPSGKVCGEVLKLVKSIWFPFTHLAREGRMTVTIGRRELLAALGGAGSGVAARGARAARGHAGDRFSLVWRTHAAGRGADLLDVDGRAKRKTPASLRVCFGSRLNRSVSRSLSPVARQSATADRHRYLRPPGQAAQRPRRPACRRAAHG